MPRSGSFNANLDPFGSGRGGLGRYNITGDTIQSLAEYEAYAVAVAWGNGKATDEEYLASLQKLVDLENPGTQGRLTAENRLADAKYSIGRNAIATKVNLASSPTERKAALQQLLAYDQARLDDMNPGNQAYREQTDRVAGTRTDLRQADYSDLVNRVNAGKATTQQLLDLAKKFKQASVGDPDNDDWTDTVDQLTDRVADEKLAQGFQDYQHNRLSGAKLLAQIDARMAAMTPGSPAYNDLKRQREDLSERIRNTAQADRAATMNGRRAEGKVSDQEFLHYLQTEYNNAPAGTNERIEAGNRLREFTFSIAEDRLRFQVQKGKKPVSSLIAFYKAARAGMDPNSERYRALTLAIDSLARGGGVGGGGGGGGGGRGGGSSSAGKGLAYYTKQLTAESVIHDFLGTSKTPPDFADLLRLDISQIASRRWWDNNLRSMVDAYQRGAREWTYYDKRGNAHQLPFNPSMMHQFDQLNYDYTRAGLAGARDVKDAQFWTGKLITATKSLTNRAADYTMDTYTKSFGDLEAMKQKALAGGRWAEYVNLTKEQTELVRFILGGTLDADASTNPYLTQAQRDRIKRDLGKIAPKQNSDPNALDYNPTGDPVLGMIADGRISITVDADGNATDGELDPNAGFLTQNPDGSIGLVEFDINAPGNSVYDPGLDQEVPKYLQTTTPAVVRVGGQDIEVRQPISDDGATLPVYVSKTGASSGSVTDYGGLLGVQPTVGQIPGTSRSVDPYVVNGAFAGVPVKTFSVREGNTTVRWVSIDGKTWLRYIPGEGPPPRIVIGSDYSFDGKKWTKDGKEVDAATVLGSAHWWGHGESQATGDAWGTGAPGRQYAVRDAEPDGRVDTRPNYLFREKKASGAREFDDSDPSAIRKSTLYTAENVSAAEQAARESITGGRFPGKGADDSLVLRGYAPRPPGPPMNLQSSRDGRAPWAGDILPVDARPKPGPMLAPPTSQMSSGTYAPRPPLPTLKPAPTPSLAPLANAKIPALKPLPKQGIPVNKPYGGPKGKKGQAQLAAAKAAADRKARAAAAAAAKKRQQAATHQQITGHAVGHGSLE